jgi:ankyrin repeat protein
MGTDAFKNVVVVSNVEYWATIGKIDRLRAALDAGGRADSADRDGYSALHGASENGHVECVRMLLERGANPRRHTHDGLSPLDLAEMGDHAAVERLLRQFGGD